MNTNDFSSLTKKYKQIISAVHIVYRLVNSTPNLKELSLRLTRLLCQFVHASSASIYLLGPDRKKLGMVAVFNNEINILLANPRLRQPIVFVVRNPYYPSQFHAIETIAHTDEFNTRNFAGHGPGALFHDGDHHRP